MFARMRLLSSIFVLLLVSCGQAPPPPPGTLTARIAADPATGSTFMTEDGWALTFTNVVVSVSSVGVSGITPPSKSKVMELTDAGVELGSNAMVEPKSYDGFSLGLARGTSEDNVNVPIDIVNRLGPRPLLVRGTASKQSTFKTFELTVPSALDFTACMPAVTVASGGSSIVEFRVSPQRLFYDDAAKLRFEGWAAADGFPRDDNVTVTEAQNVMTSMLPAAHYGMTAGSLQTVFEKRALTLIGVGDSGSCTGAAR